MLVSDKRDLKYKKDYKIQRTWYIYMGFSEAKNVIIVNSYHLTTDHKILKAKLTKLKAEINSSIIIVEILQHYTH